MEGNDKKTIKISLLGFLLFYMILLILDNSFELEMRSIQSLSLDDLNKNVKVQGELEEQRLINENLFLQIREKNRSLKVIAFDIGRELEIGKNYIVEGKITMYKQELEIIAKKIRCQNCTYSPVELPHH